MTFFATPSSIRVVQLIDWLDWASGFSKDYKIVLPMIQRGFVWKPSQIIELWDSLLCGMPIGSLMVSEMEADYANVPLPGIPQPLRGELSDPRLRLGLVDGQQRTLALLLGWNLHSSTQASHRLWVDFAETPPAGQLLRLRVTTKNQPFGFRRDDPNAKLSMGDRRKAREVGNNCKMGVEGTQQPQSTLENTSPYAAGAAHSLPLDLAELIALWRESRGRDWEPGVLAMLKAVETIKFQNGQKILFTWESADAPSQEQFIERILSMEKGLRLFFKAEIPLLPVDAAFFRADDVQGLEPPLARLFKRIGTNASPLLPPDYIYSILKHLMPEVHDMVESLYAQGHIASLLTSSDLVMSSLRLAATAWKTPEGKPVTDYDNPSKEDFHRLIWPKEDKSGKTNETKAGERQANLRVLLSVTKPYQSNTLGSYFEIVHKYLAYRGCYNPDTPPYYSNRFDPGLPPHIFPYIGRPLVQVLLRLAQCGYLTMPVQDDRRADLLRLTLYWMQWVREPPRASLLAFQVISDLAGGEHAGGFENLCREIYKTITNAKKPVGLPLRTPRFLMELCGLTGNNLRVLGDTLRFSPDPDEPDAHRQARGFYRRWWRHWNYRHPMLLWLQRAYVNRLPGNPMAGFEEDTPYDFDHILPCSHWGDWTGIKEGQRLLDCKVCDRDARWVIGNAIGNVRVWDASVNRGDGDASPWIKLATDSTSDDRSMRDLLKMSAISSGVCDWRDCSPRQEHEKKIWDDSRALAFQRAVEGRSFHLYKRLFKEAGFEKWS